MIPFRILPYRLYFKRPAITSRSRMLFKDTYFLQLLDESEQTLLGQGEIAMFKGLSAEDIPEFQQKLQSWVCDAIKGSSSDGVPSCVRFGVETALNDMAHGGEGLIFPSKFTMKHKSIRINGLIWMGNQDEMKDRIKEKFQEGFHCIKLKIGGIEFEEELNLIKFIRNEFQENEMEIRLDANGSFSKMPCEEALKKLELISKYKIHSIEQPFRAGERKKTACLCREGIIPVALDEELIGVNSRAQKMEILDEIGPDYIVLKPSLCGGFKESEDWIDMAEKHGFGWWITSALESTIGLNAIAQWTGQYKTENMAQGLGTGELYLNDFAGHLKREGEFLYYDGIEG